jgi:hypothetical protein
MRTSHNGRGFKIGDINNQIKLNQSGLSGKNLAMKSNKTLVEIRDLTDMTWEFEHTARAN